MDKAPYLKEQLQTNIPKLVTLVKRAGSYPETDFTTKQPTGRNEYLYILRLPDGVECRHYAKEDEEEVLKLFQPGETVQVVRQERKNPNSGKDYKICIWTPPEGSEARSAAQPQSGSNTHLDGERRKLEELEKTREQRWERIAASKIIHGFMLEAYKLGKTPEGAANDAIAFYTEQKKAVEKVCLAGELSMDYPRGPEQDIAIEDLPF